MINSALIIYSNLRFYIQLYLTTIFLYAVVDTLMFMTARMIFNTFGEYNDIGITIGSIGIYLFVNGIKAFPWWTMICASLATTSIIISIIGKHYDRFTSD